MSLDTVLQIGKVTSRKRSAIVNNENLIREK